MDEVDPDKSAKLESARRFCDLMEEEEDISLAQSGKKLVLTNFDCNFQLPPAASLPSGLKQQRMRRLF